MIYITGDVHGDINRFSEAFIPNEASLTENDYLIICGDFGFIFDNDDIEKEWLDTLSKKPYKILWVDGNHENFDVINSVPTEEWHGGKIHRIRDNIYHLMRGQVFNIEGKNFFTFGGAYSIDRPLRKRGVSYWDEEIPNIAEYNEATENLSKYDKIDCIITHTAPREIIRSLGYFPDEHDVELTGFLEWVMYEYNFGHWFFGHFHEDRELYDKFTALFFDVVKID